MMDDDEGQGPEDGVRALVAALQAAQSAVDPFLILHTQDTIVVNFGGRRVLGRDDLRHAMESALASPLAAVTTTSEIDDIRFVRPDVALVSCTKHVRDDREATERLTGKLTYLAVRDDGEWRAALAQTTPVADALNESGADESDGSGEWQHQLVQQLQFGRRL